MRVGHRPRTDAPHIEKSAATDTEAPCVRWLTQVACDMAAHVLSRLVRERQHATQRNRPHGRRARGLPERVRLESFARNFRTRVVGGREHIEECEPRDSYLDELTRLAVDVADHLGGDLCREQLELSPDPDRPRLRD